MKPAICAIVAAAAAACALPVQAAESHHTVVAADAVKWGPAPPSLPPGAQAAVLLGSPAKEGPFVVRLKFPANYAIPAHSHPTDEHVVVTSGSVTFGMGDALNKGAANKTLAVGGFALMPAQMNHFAYTTGQEATIVLYGQGPVEFKYVNPSDDPRYGKKGSD